MIQKIKHVLQKYWGYDRFLPLQEQAMHCVGRGRDSIVVLPTGGGKSLCFQAPALTMPGIAVVISPLISLMKDQVDALSECGTGCNSCRKALHNRGVKSRMCLGKTISKLLYGLREWLNQHVPQQRV